MRDAASVDDRCYIRNIRKRLWQMEFQIGQIIRMKKPHPCGGNTWEIQRVGMDFRLKCQTCGHMVMLPRAKFEKSVKKIVKTARDTEK